MTKQAVAERRAASAEALEGKRDSVETPIDFLEPAEFDRLVAGCNTACPTGLRNRAMLDLMHKSGLRISEATAVRRRDIKWDEHQLVLPRTKGGNWRTVPVLDSSLALMARWDEVRRMNARLRGEAFFCTFSRPDKPSGPVDHSYVRKLVKRLARKAKLDGLERFHPHALRHSCATNALSKGMDIRRVQEILGHKRLTTTMVYLKACPKGLTDEYRRIMEGGKP